MAEGYLMKRLKETGMEDVMVLSSGTAASSGMTPTKEAIETMKDEGIDVSGYLSSGLIEVHVKSADVVLVMEKAHKERVLEMAPEANEKTYFLSEFSSDKTRRGVSIKDPIGRSIGFYKETFEIIKDSIEGFLKWIKE